MFENDQPAFDPWCSHLITSRATRAVQIWMRRALSLTPIKVLTLRFCFRVLKKTSICHRSLSMELIVVDPHLR